MLKNFFLKVLVLFDPPRKYLFIRGRKAEDQELPAIREKLPCWRLSKLPRLVKLTREEFDSVAGNTQGAFMYLRLGMDYYVLGIPATPDEIKETFGCVSGNENVVRLILPAF